MVCVELVVEVWCFGERGEAVVETEALQVKGARS